ncbi:MAG: hypothetical protein EGP67_03240 [Bacteroidales bacterium]|nr:hypothetical protein [Bacteroidales bacterium]
MRKFVYLLVCLAVAVSAAAQTPQQRMSREQLAETQAKYIARELALDDNLSSQFVTTYCECQKEIWALGPRSGKDCSMQERFDRSQKLLDIRQKYYRLYSRFLTDRQIENVYKLERRMMHRMQSKHKENGRKQKK